MNKRLREATETMQRCDHVWQDYLAPYRGSVCVKCHTFQPMQAKRPVYDPDYCEGCHGALVRVLLCPSCDRERLTC